LDAGRRRPGRLGRGPPRRRLHRWLDGLGIGRAVLVGHDLGGGVAQIAAVERPDRCAGLVLTNAVSYDSWPIPVVRAMRAVPGVVARTPTPALKASIGALLARGHDDVRIAREGQRLARDLGTRAWRIAGGKHFTPEDHPAVVAGAVHEVVAEGDASR
jgi:pimeloyl-ACP methyl ester carboxylesterase